MTEAKPLTNIKVVELAHWVAGPAACGVLADWGADVVKVEPRGGEPMRRLFARPGDDATTYSPAFAAVNRGKRSIELDLADPAERASFDELLAQADVFLTNLRPQALESLGLQPDPVAARFPRLIYCSVTAYGWEGPDREQAGYDLAGFFARSGVLHQITTQGGAPAPLMNGMGDMFTAMSAAAGILAALVDRNSTNRGRFLEASLLRTGMWAVAGELATHASGANARPVAPRENCPTPLFNVYRAGDDRWFVLVGVEADRHLPAVLAAIGRPDVAEDERFASGRSISRNRREFIAILDAAFATKPLEEWASIFAAHDVWWGPVQTPTDVLADAQAHAAGAWVPLAQDTATFAVDSPIRFDHRNRASIPAAPAVGEHCDEILRALQQPRS